MMYRTAFAAVLVFGMTAEAQSLTFEYTGETFMCGNPDNPIPIGAGCPEGAWLDPDGSGSVPGWHAMLTIDERLFPGRSVAGATFSYTTFLGTIDPGDTEDTHHWWVEIVSPAGTFHDSGKSHAELQPEDIVPFFLMGGDLRQFFLPYSIMEHGFVARFDENRNIVYSYGYFADGGSTDFSHSLIVGDILYGADSSSGCRTWENASGSLSAYGVCSAPGRWEMVSDVPAPVPLPGAIWMYAAAMSAFFTLRKARGPKSLHA